MAGVAEPSAEVLLPSSNRSPLAYLVRRVAIATSLILFVALVAYVDRGGYADNNGGEVGFLDALYYSTVSVTTTGYGDIAPVTDRARLLTTLLVTPARVLFLIILVGTTLEVLAERTRLHYREKLWRRNLKGHIIVCGFGVKGQSALHTLKSAINGPPTDIVVIDPRPEAIEEARRRGCAGVVADASSTAALEAAGIREASAVIVASHRDDSAVLITLTARELNPTRRIVASVREAENAHLLQQGGADSVVVSSGAAGRLLGHAVHSPNVVRVLEDLLSTGEGLDVIERDVAADEQGRELTTCTGRAGDRGRPRRAALRFDDERVGPLRSGDKLVCLCRA